MNVKEMKRSAKLDGRMETAQKISQCLEEGHIKASDLSIRDLAESLIPDGTEYVRSIDPAKQNGSIMEIGAGDGVDHTAFAFITSNLIFNRVRAAYMNERFVGTSLIDTTTTRLDGETIPDPGSIESGDTLTHAGMPYKRYGLGVDGDLTVPRGEKHGLIVPVTAETIFYDRTERILRQASEVGDVLGREREDRILKAILGITNTYTVGGAQGDTYRTAGAWVNRVDGGNNLVDWNQIDVANQLFAGMVHPVTGWPIEIGDAQILTTPAKAMTARRLVNASEVRTTEGSTETVAANPISGYSATSSARALSLLTADGVTSPEQTWVIGNFRRAFSWFEQWPLRVARSGRASSAAFEADIIMQFKASHLGSVAVLEPRQVVLSQADQS